MHRFRAAIIDPEATAPAGPLVPTGRPKVRPWQAVLRATDTIGRLGGDEFVVVAENKAGDGGPDELARRILRALEEPFDLGEAETAFAVSASIGVATGDRPHAQDLLRDADIALYEAKDGGKNRYVVFERRNQRTVEQGVEPTSMGQRRAP